MNKFVIVLDGKRFFCGLYEMGKVSYCECENFAFKYETKEEAFRDKDIISQRTYDCDGNPVSPERLAVYEMKFEKVEV